MVADCLASDCAAMLFSLSFFRYHLLTMLSATMLSGSAIHYIDG